MSRVLNAKKNSCEIFKFYASIFAFDTAASVANRQCKILTIGLGLHTGSDVSLFSSSFSLSLNSQTHFWYALLGTNPQCFYSWFSIHTSLIVYCFYELHSLTHVCLTVRLTCVITRMRHSNLTFQFSSTSPSRASVMMIRI